MVALIITLVAFVLTQIALLADLISRKCFNNRWEHQIEVLAFFPGVVMVFGTMWILLCI